MITFGAKLYLLQNVIVPGCQVTHPELVDEIYQQLGSGKTITESHAEWVRFNDGTQATTETLREMLIDTFQQSKIENGDVYQIIKVYLADLVLPGWKLDQIQTVHFTNPFVSLLSGFSAEFLFGAPRGDKPEERNYLNIMKELFESRMRLAPATYDHFWVRKRWGHVYFRRMTYFGMICECLKHDLFEVVPSGGEAEMKREEGDRPLAWRYAEFEIPPSHSFFELEMPGIYKVRVRRPNAVNRNVRMDIASLGIPQEIVRLKSGVEEFLSMLPPSLLLKIRYNKDERIFQLDRMVLYRVNRKRKMAPQRVSWHDANYQAPKRQKLIKLPDKLPITNAPITSVGFNHLKDLFPTVLDLKRAGEWPRGIPRTVPTWTGKVRKISNRWELEVRVATDGVDTQWIAYGAWKKNNKKANWANNHKKKDEHKKATWDNIHWAFVSKDAVKNGVKPFEY